MEPVSYRPIYLLNLDSKILSKIIANGLAVIMPTLIYPSQAGFTLGHSATSNIWKVLTTLEQARANPSSDLAIITLDAEKAFDNVSFHWLRLVLQSFVFSGPFFHLITTMCSAPSANVVATGNISNNIPLHKVTRQGCPLSPLLFNLALEPLSHHLLFYSCLRHAPSRAAYGSLTMTSWYSLPTPSPTCPISRRYSPGSGPAQG